MKEFMEKVASGEIRGEQTERGWTLKIMMELMIDMIPLFEGMSWGLLTAPDDEMFLTSDNPVVVSDPKASMNERRVQYSNMASFTFPINRRHCLQGINEGGSRPRDGMQALRSAEVRMTNRMVVEQSYKFLYAPMRSGHIQGMMEKVYKQRKPILPSLPKGILDMMTQAAK